MTPTVNASCTCGACRLVYHPAEPPEWVERGACPCSLCKHTGAWFPIDRGGEVTIPHATTLRQATLSDDPGAIELVCRACGDYIGSYWALADGTCRIALNGRLLDTDAFVFPTRPAPLHGGDRTSDAVRGELPRFQTSKP